MFYSAQKDAAIWTIKLMEKHKQLMIKVIEDSYTYTTNQTDKTGQIRSL